MPPDAFEHYVAALACTQVAAEPHTPAALATRTAWWSPPTAGPSWQCDDGPCSTSAIYAAGDVYAATNCR
jgi:hypothetical protein